MRLLATLIPVVSLTLGAAMPTIATAQSTATPPATGAAAGAGEEDPNQRIRCRSIEITGSLARRERVCKTVAEWRRLADLGNENARDIVDYSRGRPSGQ